MSKLSGDNWANEVDSCVVRLDTKSKYRKTINHLEARVMFHLTLGTSLAYVVKMTVEK
jgi:hypothetical protein